MATANEEIFDGLTRRQIGLLRLAATIGREAGNVLSEADTALRDFLRNQIARLGSPTRRRQPAATIARLRRLEAAWRERAHPAFVEANALFRSRLTEAALDEPRFVERLLSRTLPVVVSVSLPDSQTIRSLISQSVIEGSHLREMLRDWEANDRRRVFAQIRTGVLAGETPDQVGRRVFGTRRLQGSDGARAVTRRGADLIARTAMSAISNQARERTFELNQDIVEGVIYRATLDSRTTPICRALDGRRFRPGEGPRPPQHIRCRSTAVPFIDGAPLGNRPAVATLKSELDELSPRDRAKRIRELVGPTPAETNYSQFLRRQRASFQDEVLGRRRAQLFRAGRLDLDQFVDLRTGRQLTLQELGEKYDL